MTSALSCQQRACARGFLGIPCSVNDAALVLSLSVHIESNNQRLLRIQART
jgi:hypothetical protein